MAEPHGTEPGHGSPEGHTHTQSLQRSGGVSHCRGPTAPVHSGQLLPSTVGKGTPLQPGAPGWTSRGRCEVWLGLEPGGRRRGGASRPHRARTSLLLLGLTQARCEAEGN